MEDVVETEGVVRKTGSKIGAGSLLDLRPKEDDRSRMEAEWQRQTKRLIELGFHNELGLSEEEYLKSLPHFTAQPENFKERFDIKIIVDPRISIKRQCELAGINFDPLLNETTDWSGDPGGYRTPDEPYVAWVQTEQWKNADRAVSAVCNGLAADERGATVFDVIALYLVGPRYILTSFKEYSLVCTGSRVKNEYAPELHAAPYKKQPELGGGRHINLSDKYRSPFTCGRI